MTAIETNLKTMSKSRKGLLTLRISWANILTYAILIVIALAYIGPIIMLVNTAFKTQASFMKDATAPASVISIKNFADAWAQGKFARYFGNTLLYTGAATSIYVVMAVFVAFPIARGYVKGAKRLFTLFLIALFLPPGLIPQFQLILHLGLYNTQIGYIMLFLVNPIGVIILVNYIKSVPTELDEAAALDGCGYIRFVFRIIIPLILPAIATITVLHAIGIWNEVILPTIYLTNQNYYPITRGLLSFMGVYGNQWPKLAAAVLILAVPMVILYLFLQRYIISGLTQGSLKG